MDEKVGRILNEARVTLSDAEFALNGERYATVVNRTYYAVFHCVQAFLQSAGFFVKTHQRAHQKFREIYIKTGRLPSETSEILARLSDLRTLSDYEYGATITKEHAAAAYTDAGTFLQKTVEAFQKN